MNKHRRQRVVELLMNLSVLLMSGNPNSTWGRRLESIAKQDAQDSEDMRLEVRELYGGMGSLNDIVILNSNGTVDRDGSDEFDKLRTELYELVRSST